MSTTTNLSNLSCPHPRGLPTEEDIRQSKLIIKQLDQSIEELIQKIRQLHTQIQEVQQTRASYVSYLSPLRRLPEEVLREIITMCINNGADVTVMAGICSRLREVVLGMASLWSKLSLRPFDDRKRYYVWSIDVGYRSY
jgi:hypothetical protein